MAAKVIRQRVVAPDGLRAPPGVPCGTAYAAALLAVNPELIARAKARVAKLQPTGSQATKVQISGSEMLEQLRVCDTAVELVWSQPLLAGMLQAAGSCSTSNEVASGKLASVQLLVAAVLTERLAKAAAAAASDKDEGLKLQVSMLCAGKGVYSQVGGESQHLCSLNNSPCITA